MKARNHPPKPLQGTGHLPATKPQLQTLHGMKRAMAMDDDDYRTLVKLHGKGVEHSNELTRKQASALISELEIKSGSKPTLPPKPVTTQGNVVALASPPQLALIGHLVREVDWYEHGSYAAWLKKNLGLDKVVTKEQARNAIEGLKGLKVHGHAKP